MLRRRQHRVPLVMLSIKLSVNLRSSFQARIAVVITLLLLVVVGALYFSVKVATNEAVQSQARAQRYTGFRTAAGRAKPAPG